MKSKYLAILRSTNIDENKYLENLCKKLKFIVKTYPILEVKALTEKKICTGRAQALCTTSMHGISIISKLVDDREIKLFTMGESSAKVAKKKGFKNIIDCSGDSDRMLKLILNNTVKGNGEIIYAGAKKISSDLPKILAEFGYNVRRYILYDTILSRSLNKEFIKLVNKEELKWIILLSKKGAENSAKLIFKTFSYEKIKLIKFACLSLNIAEALPKGINTYYPKIPNIRELVKIISSEDINGL